MKTVKEIQVAIDRLPAGQRRKLVQWIEQRQWDQWDKQIASDIEAGKLDRMVRAVRKNIRDGKLMDMP